MSFADRLTPTTIVPAVWDLVSSCAAAAAGASHLFVSGGALSTSYGYPDQGLLDIGELVNVARRIKSVTGCPVMVDAETGYGSVQRLRRLTHELIEAGVDAMMIEDQEETGQSVRASEPGLCAPDMMCERVRAIREIAGDRIEVLARTDCIESASIDSSVVRLTEYLHAGADWVMPVFLRSPADLELAGARFPDKLFVIAVQGKTGYMPSLEAVTSAGVVAVLVTSQNRNVVKPMLDAYRQTFAGSWSELREGQYPIQKLGELLRFTRFEGGTKQ